MLPKGPTQSRQMKQVNLKLTIEELQVLTSLATDQLFRREFIDPKMPGYRTNLGELGVAKNTVARLRALLDPGLVRRAAGTVQ